MIDLWNVAKAALLSIVCLLLALGAILGAAWILAVFGPVVYFGLFGGIVFVGGTVVFYRMVSDG